MTALCAVAFVVGIAWLQQQPMLTPLTGPIAMIAGCIVAMRWPRVRRIAGVVAVCVVGFAWATWRADVRLRDHLAADVDERDIVVVGIVRDLPAQSAGFGGPTTRFEFEIEHAGAPAGHVPHYVSLVWPTRSAQGVQQPVPRIRPGERWQLRVRLRPPHGLYNRYGFDLEPWLLERGIRATGTVRAAPDNQRLRAFVVSPTAVVDVARARIADDMAAALDGARYGPVMLALVVGDQRGITQDEWNIYNRTGVSHLLSISGLHVTMFAGLVAWLATFAWRALALRVRWFARTACADVAAIAGFAGAFAYTLVSGFQVPAQRTLWMLGVVAVAAITHRASRPFAILGIAAIVVCVLDPWAVIAPGFWLSFVAVACLMLAGIGAEPRRDGPAWKRTLAEAARAQLAITVLLAPITLYYFQQASIASPLANAIAIPVVSLIVTPLALFGGLIGALTGWHLPLAVAHAIFAPLAAGLDVLAAWPIASVEWPAPSLFATICATVGAAWMLAPRGVPTRFGGALLCVPLCIPTTAMPHEGAFRATFLDIGQGTAVLVETARHRLMFDTGPKWSETSDAAQRVILPHLRAIGATRLDGLIVSHNDADHSGGALTLIANREIAWMRSSLEPTSAIVQAAPHPIRCEAGQAWSWDAVRFEVIHPPHERYAAKTSTNARSCVLRIDGAHGSALLTADIEAPQERALIDAAATRLPATVLAVAHHGSLTSSTVEFIATVDPALAVVQAGWRNRFRHPRDDVLARYAALDIPLVRTDLDGAVVVHVDTPGAPRIERWRAVAPRYWHGR